MFLEIINLTKIYGEKKAVNKANWTMNEGELVCILGPSGCGKTTLLRSIGGFVKPEEGKILLNGQNINDLPPEERPVATVFQSYGLFPHMTVMENVTYGLKFLNIGRKKALELGEEILELVNLQGYGPKKIQQLSGGEQQRVALARSLVVKPKLLLLDEPLSNLDANLRVSMRSEIKEIQEKSNVSTIFVTHDQEDAFAIADRLILMDQGKIIQVDSSEEIYENPNSEFSLKFIGDSVLREEGGAEYLRPEEVIVKGRNEQGNALIVDKLFKGSTIMYSLRLFEKEEVIKALALNRESESYQVGDRVDIFYRYKKIGGN